MNATSPLPNDPVALVRQLDAEAISNRIRDLDSERDALMVLLRAAQRKRRDESARGKKQKGTSEDEHAAQD